MSTTRTSLKREINVLAKINKANYFDRVIHESKKKESYESETLKMLHR
jgi:hypothetical protein